MYYYAIASIVFYLKNRNKKVEIKNEDQAEKNSKNVLKTMIKPTLIIVAILVVGYMGLAFWVESENKKAWEQSESAMQEFEQTGNIANWKIFTSEWGGQFQIQYPGWWQVKSSSKRDFEIRGIRSRREDSR